MKKTTRLIQSPDAGRIPRNRSATRSSASSRSSAAYHTRRDCSCSHSANASASLSASAFTMIAL